MPSFYIAGVEGRTRSWPVLSVWKDMLVVCVVLTVSHGEVGEGSDMSRRGSELTRRQNWGQQRWLDSVLSTVPSARL